MAAMTPQVAANIDTKIIYLIKKWRKGKRFKILLAMWTLCIIQNVSREFSILIIAIETVLRGYVLVLKDSRIDAWRCKKQGGALSCKNLVTFSYLKFTKPEVNGEAS